MSDKLLEDRVKALEAKVLALQNGSNNPHILLSLRAAVVELHDKQNQIAKIMKKISRASLI